MPVGHNAPFPEGRRSGTLSNRARAPRRHHVPPGRRSPTIVLVDDRGFVTARSATLRERLATVLQADAIDRELAAGADPECRPTLAIRAQQLATPRRREELASAFARVLAAAVDPSRTTRARWGPIRSDHVRESADDLRLLIDHLRAPAPVAAQGVAISRLLVCNAASPLYRGTSAAPLRHQVALAISAL